MNPIRWLKSRSQPTEDSNEYDGVLSYAAEWHALTIGVGAGFAAGALGRPAIAGAAVAGALGIEVGKKFGGRGVLHELQREPWYGIAGVPVGYAVTVLPI